MESNIELNTVRTARTARSGYNPMGRHTKYNNLNVNTEYPLIMETSLNNYVKRNKTKNKQNNSSIGNSNSGNSDNLDYVKNSNIINITNTNKSKGKLKNKLKPNDYSVCGRNIIEKLQKEKIANIYKSNINYADIYSQFTNTFNEWLNHEKEGALSNYLVKLYRNNIKKHNINITNLEYPVFYSPTINLADSYFNNSNNKFEVNKLYSEIKSSDIVRIWLILDKHGTGRHIASEIVTESGKHFSFGFTYSEKTVIKTPDLYLMSPDTILNFAMFRQIENPGMTMLKLIHESEIGEESYSRLMKFFNSVFEGSNATEKLVKILMNTSYFKISKDESETLNKHIQQQLNPTDNNIKELRTLVKDIKKSNDDDDQYVFTIGIAQLWNITEFLGDSCCYNFLSGKLRNSFNKLTIGNKCRRGINCVYGAHLLFEDLIKCGDKIVIPSKCESTKKYTKCSVNN